MKRVQGQEEISPRAILERIRRRSLHGEFEGANIFFAKSVFRLCVALWELGQNIEV